MPRQTQSSSSFLGFSQFPDSGSFGLTASPNSEMIDHSGDISNVYDNFSSGNPTISVFSQETCSFDSQGSLSSVESDDDSVSSVLEIHSNDHQENIIQDSAVLDVQNDENLGDSSEDMDVDVDVDGKNDPVAVCDKFSGPYFLRRLLRKELDGKNIEEDDDHRILVIAVHAVMLESGFVSVDPVTKMRVDRFYLPEVWPSLAFSMSLHYSFPGIPLGRGCSTESVVLGCQSLGQFMNVYGSLERGKSDLRRVCLNESVVSPKIESLSCDCYAAKEVIEFWKVVKDNLALPLLIDLSERAGLALPSCFTCLPMELKAKILELLTGIDLAKVGFVCSELFHLSTNNDLWKQKCIEEFGDRVLAVPGITTSTSGAGSVNWKQVFLRSWKEKTIESALHHSLFRSGPPLIRAEIDIPVNRMGREGEQRLRMFGGDYSRLPPFIVPDPRYLYRTGVIPCCILGGAIRRHG